ncbi:MAG: VOC family protein [Alphaproteobacteria bacterium]|nr:VOC family protein [Alphaproteobacteria bacterium]MBU0798252.1 VOC family protein [Alphaproteobacteria bacterium]MBU0889014.1 VOC family protein [Alphaproteobacteria bacterium]MBU1814034.1 VOC family protein [Alphaproteobacteria bacterium]
MTSPFWPIEGLDHVLIAVRDLAAAKQEYERLGFRTTPMGRHTTLGSINHCIMLERDYLELLALAPDTDIVSRWTDMLKQREGVGALALKSSDARGAEIALRRAGVETGEATDFARPVVRPEGTREARFTTLQIEQHSTPGIREFLCQHHTPELVWLPEYQSHPNQAKAVAEIFVVTTDPGPVTAGQERMFNTRTMGNSPHARVIETGTATLTILTPAAYTKRFPKAALDQALLPFVAGFSIRLRDTAAAAAYFRKAGVTLERSADGRAYVPPSQARGALIQFEMPA